MRNWWHPLRAPQLRKKKARRTSPHVRPQLENLEYRLTPSFTVGPNINTTKSAGGEAEDAIAVNPTNAQNLFVSSTGTGGHHFSLDGGKTWADSDTSAVMGGISGGDEQLAWDSFGNLF